MNFLTETLGAYLIPVQGTFDTREAAEGAIEGYYRSYPAAGYGTELRITRVGGQWQVEGHRFASCD